MANELEDYVYLWEKPLHYVLCLVPSWLEPFRDICWGKSEYAIFMKEGVFYLPYTIQISDIALEVHQRMIDAGVEILEKVPDGKLEELAEAFWTSRKDEFALLKLKHPHEGYYDIYQKRLGTVIPSLPHTFNLYNYIVTKMLENGAEIIDELPNESEKNNLEK